MKMNKRVNGILTTLSHLKTLQSTLSTIPVVNKIIIHSTTPIDIIFSSV